MIATRKKCRRVGFTPAQSSELWDRWQTGEGVTSIGRVLGEPSSCIFNHLKPSGGIRTAERTRASLALTLAEREEISRGIAVGRSLRAIAGSLGRSPSTVSREIARNGEPARYRAAGADKRARVVARRAKVCKPATAPRLCRAVARKLERTWSPGRLPGRLPGQIAGWLKRRYPDEPAWHVSHETIYRSLFVQARGVLKRGVLKRGVLAHLRSRRPIRRSWLRPLKKSRGREFLKQ